jgi:hypothetical protein
MFIFQIGKKRDKYPPLELTKTKSNGWKNKLTKWEHAYVLILNIISFIIKSLIVER